MKPYVAQAVERGIDDTPGRAEFRASSCIGKEPYATAGLARKVLKRRQRKGGSRSLLCAYRCSFCGSYHIGSEIRRSEKQAVRSGRRKGPNKSIT